MRNGVDVPEMALAGVGASFTLKWTSHDSLAENLVNSHRPNWSLRVRGESDPRGAATTQESSGQQSARPGPCELGQFSRERNRERNA